MINKHFLRLFLFFLISFLTLVWILLAVPRNLMMVSDQAVGETIYFKALAIKKAGHVVFQKEGEIISASDYLPAGIYADINLEPFFLFINQPFQPGELTIVLYQDNGDTIFNPDLDQPAKNIWSQTSQKTINLTADVGLKVDLGELIKNCQSSDRKIDYECFRDRLTPLVKRPKLAELADNLDSLFSSSQTRAEYGTISCHGPAHVLGEIAIDQGLDWQEVAQSCGQSCDYGCIHGAFNRQFVSDPNFSGEFKSICTQVVEDIEPSYQNDACYHLVGHALGETYNQLSQALTACRQMDLPYQKGHCTEGALMDHLFGAPGRPAGFSGDLADLISLCNSLDSSQQGICWQNLGLYALSLYGSQQEVIVACQKAATPWRAGCFRSLGERAYFSFAESWQEAVRFCDQAGPHAVACLYGAIESDIADSRESDFSLSVCLNLGPARQADCLNFVNEITNYIWSK